MEGASESPRKSHPEMTEERALGSVIQIANKACSLVADVLFDPSAPDQWVDQSIEVMGAGYRVFTTLAATADDEEEKREIERHARCHAQRIMCAIRVRSNLQRMIFRLENSNPKLINECNDHLSRNEK